MANERLVLCGGATSSDPPIGGTPLRLRMWGRHPNVDLQINAIAEALTAPVPEALLDLVDIATYVYCADQAITRGGAGVENLGADWRRRLHFVVPVRAPDLWSSKPAQVALTTTLGFLSDDDYSFVFVPMKEGPELQDYLFGEDGGSAGGVEEVVLFSGGLDSLAGAIQEAVVDGRRIALVTHQPSPKLVTRYEKLKTGLMEKAPHTPLFVPVTINKLKSMSREYTQRSRSFLYVALGASVAKALGLSRVRFYENGVISLNLPPSGQVVGAKATRTTHPRVLRGFAEILTLVTGSPFTVENPFLWRTKTDVVRGIITAGCADMIKFSTSCTHTWEMTKIHPHCGSCSQCIDRRFAVLAAAAGALDPEAGYKVKLLTEGRPEDEKRTMLASYAETASNVSRMSQREFLAKFGEVSRVLRYIPGSADDAARLVYDLHRRHGQEVSGVVDQAIAAHAREIRERSLPASCLLRLVCDTHVAVAATEAQPSIERIAPQPDPLRARNYFVKKGDRAWQVRFDGGSDFVLVLTRGAAYLHLLLNSQGTPISAAKLAATVASQPEEYMRGDAGEASDGESMTAFRAHHEELKEEMKTARRENDKARQEQIQGDMAKLLKRIEASRGLGGRVRKDADNRERVRKAVWIAIKRVLKDIEKYDRRLAEHLRTPTLKGGLHPCYSPPQVLDWQLV